MPSSSRSDIRRHSVAVIGLKHRPTAVRLVRELLSIGFVPVTLFPAYANCRYFVAIENKTKRPIYILIGGPRGGSLQWSFIPQFFKSRLKVDAFRALERYVSDPGAKPMLIYYDERALK